MRFASQIRSRPLSPGTFVLDISTILLRRFTTVFLPLHKNSSLFCLGFKIESPSDIFCQSFPGENISAKDRYMRVYSFSIEEREGEREREREREGVCVRESVMV